MKSIHRYMRGSTLVALSLLIGACSPNKYSMLKGDRVYQKRIDQLWDDQVFPINESIHRIDLQRTEFQAVQAVQFAGDQKPHSASQDITLVMQKGSGTLFVNSFPIPMSAGDVATIPRGASHYFVSASTSSMVQAILIISPPSEPRAEEVTHPSAKSQKKVR